MGPVKLCFRVVRPSARAYVRVRHSRGIPDLLAIDFQLLLVLFSLFWFSAVDSADCLSAFTHSKHFRLK